MRKIFLGFMLIWTGGSFLGELVNEFSSSKETYALFTVNSSFRKDTLINIESAISRYGRQANPNRWVYEGDLINAKKKNILMNINEETFGNETPDSLMVWYCEYANITIKRSSDGLSRNPFIQYRFFRDTFAGWSLFFLFIPNLLWYLALQFPQRKKLFYGIIGAYFLLFVYGCITDFEIIKQHMDYFKHPQNSVSVTANATTSQIQLPDDYDPFWFVDYGTPRFDNHLKLMGERSLWQNIKHEWIIILTIIAWIVGTTLALKFKNKKNEK